MHAGCYSRRVAATVRPSPLSWIIAFKAVKSATLATLGVVLLATRHADPVDLLFRLALAVHLPLTSKIFDRALAFATNLTINEQVGLALTAFFYAALMG